MEARDFLDRVRACLARDPQDGEPPGGEPPTYQPPEPPGSRERVERLVLELEAVGGTVHRVDTPAGARDAVLRILGERDARRVVRTNAPALHDLDLDDTLEEAGIETTVCDLRPGKSSREALRRAALAADAGITSADYGVAETGTLALLAAPGNGRAVSLLPPVHIAVLDASDVVQELSALFERIEERGELPSALTLVTGPSRTGDIELVLTVGVHGPGELHLVLVG